MEPIKIGLAGLGHRGLHWLRHLQEIEGYRVTALCGDIAHRFHIPYAVCVHPDNWVKYSEQQGRTLLRQASERGLPTWSFDQWLDFWETRHTWRFEALSWDGETLRFRAAGARLHGGLRIVLPVRFGGKILANVQAVRRYGEDQMLVEPLDLDGTFSARYTTAA